MLSSPRWGFVLLRPTFLDEILPQAICIDIKLNNLFSKDSSRILVISCFPYNSFINYCFITSCFCFYLVWSVLDPITRYFRAACSTMRQVKGNLDLWPVHLIAFHSFLWRPFRYRSCLSLSVLYTTEQRVIYMPDLVRWTNSLPAQHSDCAASRQCTSQLTIMYCLVYWQISYWARTHDGIHNILV